MNVIKGMMSIVAVAVSAVAFGQADIAGPQQYPQFRGLSGLPGGGFPLTYDGRIAYGGAMGLSTPVAYGLGHWRVIGTFSFLATEEGGFPLLSGSGGELFAANGTATQGFGIYAKGVGHFSIINMIVSTRGDNTTNYQLSIPVSGDERTVLALGIQDVSGQIGSAGDTFPVEDRRLSRSGYVVLTTPLGEWGNVSGGWGTERFRRPFVNVSGWVDQRTVLFVEQDGYNVNAGGAYLVPMNGLSLYGREATLTVNASLVRGKYPNLAFTLSF